MYARIYARVSTEEQAASGFSLGAQKERLHAYCLSQDWTVAGEYVDEGVSAKDLGRPQFRRMMADAKPGEIILVYKLDRLTRSVRDLDDLLRDFEQRGLLFRSVTEQFDTTTATGRLFMRMIAEMAQWERETIAERTAFGKRRKAATGEWAGGPVPFGYSAVPSEKTRAGRTLLKLVPDPERQHLVPMIFERYLSGQGIRAIARWLNEELGARTPRGCKFHQLSVRRILTNPIYCGEIVHGRRLGRVTSRVRGNHTPLVPRELFERAAQLLDLHKDSAPRHATGPHPLAGVARCGVCGARIDGQTRNRATGRRIYRCHGYATGVGCGAPPLTGISAAQTEAALIREIDRLLTPPPPALAGLLAEYDGAPDTAGAERYRLEQDLLEAEAAIRRWKRLFEKGHIAEEEYLGEVTPHQERIRQLRGRLSTEQPSPKGRPVHGTPTLSEAWPALAPAERKALLQHFTRAFGVQILLFPDRRVALHPV
ncbi:MAG TPA: recombinase family protein [Symbiobacteriaceae bacterium]|nr:recombinase family protein [Symbiobacteriaceae bacterium]